MSNATVITSEFEFAPSSPQYISPEQLLNEPVTPLTDLYSFGLVLYELLTGQHPFADDALDEVIKHHLRDPLPLVQKQRRDVPPEVDAVIQRATAKQPAARYPDALTMAAAFRNAVLGNGYSANGNPLPLLKQTWLILTKVYTPFKKWMPQLFMGVPNFVEQLIARLNGAQFLAIVGPSGSGKSSVAKAGVIPALRQGALPGSENWFIAAMTPGDKPLRELQIALTQIAVDPPPDLLDTAAKRQTWPDTGTETHFTQSATMVNAAPFSC